MSVAEGDLDVREVINPAPPGPVALALWASGLRCLLVYVALPALGPVVGGRAIVTGPIVLAACALGIGTSANAVIRARSSGRHLAAMASVVLVLLNVLGLVAWFGR